MGCCGSLIRLHRSFFRAPTNDELEIAFDFLLNISQRKFFFMWVEFAQIYLRSTDFVAGVDIESKLLYEGNET